MIEKITSSFISDMTEYVSGDLCGNIIREKWVNDRILPLDSEAAALGCYFEFLISGAIPKDGKIPEPAYQASKIKANKGKIEGLGIEEMYEPYRLAHAHADLVRGYLDKLGLKILRAGVTLTKGRFKGTIDLICECTKRVVFHDGSTWNIGDKIMLDLKYSGLLEDKWDKFGWAGLKLKGDNLQKNYRKVQSRQYRYISELPFHFLVQSSGKGGETELIYINITDLMLNEHIAEANDLFEQFLFQHSVGFTPRPDLKKCNVCPLKDECTDKHTYPHPIAVVL